MNITVVISGQYFSWLFFVVIITTDKIIIFFEVISTTKTTLQLEIVKLRNLIRCIFARGGSFTRILLHSNNWRFDQTFWLITTPLFQRWTIYFVGCSNSPTSISWQLFLYLAWRSVGLDLIVLTIISDSLWCAPSNLWLIN